MDHNRHLRCRRAILLVMLMALVSLLGACGPAESETVTIGVANPLNIGGIVEGFKSGLADLEYVEGENVVYVEAEPPSDMSALGSSVAGLLEEEVDLILCVTTPVCSAAQQATAGTEVAVLFVAVTDPVAAGLVQDFAQPGGNVTGIASAAKGAVNEGRALEWLLQAAPGVQRVFIPHNPDDPVTLTKLAAVQDAATQLGVELVLQEVRTPDEAVAIPGTIPGDVDALVTFSERVFTVPILQEFAAAAIERKLPYLAPGTEYGALLSYAPELSAMGRQSARLADQIFQGTKPASLPVETPEFFLTVNLVTAEAIGLEVPNDVLRQADTVLR